MSIMTPNDNSIVFASSGLKNIIPLTSVTAGAASMTSGFPAQTMKPKSEGGIPPRGHDMNGILYQLSSHQVYLNAGGMYKFSEAYASAINGYRQGAVLQSNDGLSAYISSVDSNMDDPNTGATNWKPYGGKLLEDRIQAVESGLTVDESRIQDLENSFSTDHARIGDLESALTEDEARILTLENALSADEVRIQDLESTLSEYESRIDTLEQAVPEEIAIDDVYITFKDFADGAAVAAHKRYGSWARVAEGQFILGAGTHTDTRGEAKSFTIGDSGGEYRHVQTEAEMAAHVHPVAASPSTLDMVVSDEKGGYDESSIVPDALLGITAKSDSADELDDNYSIKPQGWAQAGENQPMNITPPYIAMAIWRRTA